MLLPRRAWRWYGKKTTTSFKLADIGEGITEVQILNWFVKEGESIKQFDKIAEVQSDKATVDITSKYDGVVKRVYYKESDMAKVGAPLIDVEVDESEPGDSQSAKSETKQSVARAAADSGALQAPIAPRLRRVAADRGIDLSLVRGSGPGGRILETDLAMTPFSAFQRVMIRKMTESLQIPHFSLSDEVDVTDLYDFVKSGGRYMMAYFVKALSATLSEMPILNANYFTDAPGMVLLGAHNIGIAIDSRHGLVVPAVRDVQAKPIDRISADISDLVERADANCLRPDDFEGIGITISNIGSIAGVFAHPVIVSPQVAILVLGRVRELPRCHGNGLIVPRRILPVTWSADHRVIDGATVARASLSFATHLSREFPRR